MANEKKLETQKEILNRFSKRDYLKHKLNIRIIFCVFLLVVSFITLYFGFSKQNLYSINKIEKGITDYKVYLNKDDIYNNDYQKSGFSYISSTINYVKANYNYELKFDKDIKTKYSYDVVSILTIKEPGENGKELYVKQYNELDTVKGNDKDIFINEDIKIDYKKYNNIVENYKKKYGVSVDAYLKTDMVISIDSLYEDDKVFNEVRELSTNIPLGEHTLIIDTNKPINSVEELTGDKKLKLNFIFIIIGICLLVFSITYLIKVIKLVLKYEKLNTNYDVKLDKILKEYDRIIVETDKTKIKQDFKNVITVNNFLELVDVRDNTEQPILYVNKKVGREADFMVINDETLYIFNLNIEKL